MRSDYALYVVAVIFFLLTAIAAVLLAEPERPAWVVATAILGLLFIGLGYSQKPKLKAAAMEISPPAPPAPPATVTEVVEEKRTATVVETAPPKIELTEVQGIGAKRAEQLKGQGINSVDDLAKASAEDLAEKLKISPKITRKWIESAKKLVEKS